MSSRKCEAPTDMRSRPLLGGPFGQGRYVMATVPCIDRGLHAVRHMIVEPRAGSVLAVSLDKREAIAAARRLLRAAGALELRQASRGIPTQQTALWADDQLEQVAPPRRARTPSRRRVAIFKRSEGRCFYCRTAIDIETFHVEHQLPRALGGGDGSANLVAACPTCNLSKQDLTAIEFIASHGAQGGKG